MLARTDLAHTARGFLMGGADIIPGVSGGTVALILGIYQRLVTAISRFDLTFLSDLKSGRIRAAAAHVDLRFLGFLGLGAAIGIIGLASTMHYLLEHQLERTLAAFFGMILASSLIVARQVEGWNLGAVAMTVGGAVLAFGLVGLPFLDDPPDSKLYLFGCGMVAICAMILPGISGAFILLILGKYFLITGLLKGLAKGEFSGEALLTVAVFAGGALVGLLGFSKVLRYLLANWHRYTMALLCGFMLGSLRKIWPFKLDRTPELEFKYKQFDNVAPDFSTSAPWVAIGIAIAAFTVVVLLERLATPRGEQTSRSS